MNSNNFEKKKLEIVNLYREKKFENVLKLGVNLLKKNPNDTQLIFILGLTTINLQNYLESEKYFKILVTLKKTPEIYYIFGNIQKKLKKFKDAVIAYEYAIKLNPNFSEAYNNLGNTKKLINEKEDAINCFKNAIKLKPNNIQALFNLSSIYKENNNFDDLIEIYKKILDLDKNNIKTLYNLGTAYLYLGNITEGKKYLKKVIELDEFNVPSFRNYVNTTKIDKNDKFFQKFTNINVDLFNNQDKILIYDTLSKGYFDLNKIEIGFNYLSKVNKLKKENSKYSLETQEKIFANIKKLFSKIDDLNLGFKNKIKKIPIFIIGMPRSGTSLIEQILSSHSQIHGAGELNYLPKIIDKLGLNEPKDFKKYFALVRDYYLENLSKISEKQFIIDKLPINFKWIGFIINAFPEAKIIHIHRNPMAVCWSNYKTLFVDSGMDFNLNQEDTANFYVLYSNLMKFWSKKFSKKIFNVNYDNFVKDFENQTKEILSNLRLDWEDQQKNYLKTHRVVMTASFQQVREKIKKNTSTEWEKYNDYLAPMKKILQNNGIKF